MTPTERALAELQARILSHDTLLFLKSWEEDRWEQKLSDIAMEIERGLAIWSATQGLQPPLTESDNLADPAAFVASLPKCPADHIYLLRDFHPYLRDPKIVRTLRDMVTVMTKRNQTLVFLGPQLDIPTDIRTDAAIVDLPLPAFDALREELETVLEERRQNGEPELELDESDIDRLLKAVLGLTLREAHRAFTRVLAGRRFIDDNVSAQLVSEKKRMVQGSDLLEFHELDDSINNVGGLESLKEWLIGRSEAYSQRARELGVPMPKGMLLLGVQGCGKSMTARATAKLLGFPLVRLDVSALLTADQGASERNMRDVLNVVETIAPTVLWLDEIEKGFAGMSGSSGQDATLSRLLGRFLMWMEERNSPVFVVATANSVEHLPPELLRRGRFDELFFVDLPNHHERRTIFQIHLMRNNWKPELFDTFSLANETEAYSGAEIATIVNTAVLDAFGDGRPLTQEDLREARQSMVPLSVTMEEKVFALREWARRRCRPATPDSRVQQILEEEERDPNYVAPEDREDEMVAWRKLAEHGQYNSAFVEYIREYDGATFGEMQESFADYFETDGPQGLALRSEPNAVLWVGMSAQFAEMLSKVLSARRLYLHPTDAEEYTVNGYAVKLPVLEELPETPVPKPHWFPMRVRDFPAQENSGRFARVARMMLAKK